MTVRLPFCRFLAIFIFFTFSPISLVFMIRFSKFFQLYISKSNFTLFEENNYDSQTAFLQVFGYFIFFTFSPISLVFLVRFSKFFQLKISKLNFPSFGENNNDGQTAFLQVSGYFYIFYIFPHIFGVFSPIFKIFSVKDIKIKFHVVWRNNHDGQSHPQNFVLRYVWMLSSLLFDKSNTQCFMSRTIFSWINKNTWCFNEHKFYTVY